MRRYCCPRTYFYPRPPRGGRRGTLPGHGVESKISIHALREEGDRCPNSYRRCGCRFLSTPSARRATLDYLLALSVSDLFLSTPSARRATRDAEVWRADKEISIHALREEGDHRCGDPGNRCGISIHALREEGDLWPEMLQRREVISIHALREEGDRGRQPADQGQRAFLSTPSARRATVQPEVFRFDVDNFYPRPPRGGRQEAARDTAKYYVFLSTPSARRATKFFLGQSQQAQDFYPRPPRGGRRCVDFCGILRCVISIHALREEGDVFFVAANTLDQLFLSTPSARRATLPELPLTAALCDFYPRPPRGGRPGMHRVVLFIK